MNDDDFLGYAWLHARTPRALFAVEDIQRLHKLAGTACPELPEKGFLAMRSDYANPLIERARVRRRLVVLPGGRS
jgi:hypothetical protein